MSFLGRKHFSLSSKQVNKPIDHVEKKTLTNIIIRPTPALPVTDSFLLTTSHSRNYGELSVSS